MGCQSGMCIEVYREQKEMGKGKTSQNIKERNSKKTDNMF